MAGGKERLTRRDRKAAETGEPKKVGPKLTQEEQDELEEKEWRSGAKSGVAV